MAIIFLLEKEVINPIINKINDANVQKRKSLCKKKGNANRDK
jgi:hypothetical protein